MVPTQTDIEVLNFAFNFGPSLGPMKHERHDTSITDILRGFWLLVNGTGFLVCCYKKFFILKSSLRNLPLEA